MSIVDEVENLRTLTALVPITRANIDEILDTHRLEIHMKDGRWWVCRRNGKTRRWVRSPGRIYVPFKYGFKFYGNITEDDFTYIPGSKAPDRPDTRDYCDQIFGSLNSLYFRVKPPADVR